jgi:hypothetical protein
VAHLGSHGRRPWRPLSGVDLPRAAVDRRHHDYRRRAAETGPRVRALSQHREGLCRADRRPETGISSSWIRWRGGSRVGVSQPGARCALPSIVRGLWNSLPSHVRSGGIALPQPCLSENAYTGHWLLYPLPNACSAHWLLCPSQNACNGSSAISSGVGRYNRASTRRTCDESHCPFPVMVGTPRTLSALAMPFNDVAPAVRKAVMMGATSAALSSARFLRAPQKPGEPLRCGCGPGWRRWSSSLCPHNRAGTRRTYEDCHDQRPLAVGTLRALNQGVVAIHRAAIMSKFGASHRWMARQSPSEPSSLVPGGALVAFWPGPFTLRAARTPGGPAYRTTPRARSL